MRLTKSIVDKAVPPTDKDQVFYRDTELIGFALRVTTKGVKSFVIETLIDRKVRRVTLGKYGKLTVEQARKLAKDFLGRVARGENPLAERKMQAMQAITLQQAFNDYLAAHKSLKQTTRIDYQRVCRQVFPDWLEIPLTAITREKVVKRHTDYGENNSKARANLAMRLLRAIFNFAIDQYQTESGASMITLNPVRVLSYGRSWYRIERRQTLIQPYQLKDWYLGLEQLRECYICEQAELWQDYFLFILLTGLRRSEASSLAWKTIDLKAKTFALLDTKNRNTHRLPMSDFIYDLLMRRQKISDSTWVFPASSRTGHIMEPRKAMLKLAELSGVTFTLHDLRRTFITAAERLDISAYALKRLLNHKMRYDVTSGYLVIDVERLRGPMQQVTEYLLGCMGISNALEYTYSEETVSNTEGG